MIFAVVEPELIYAQDFCINKNGNIMFDMAIVISNK